jgi:hypothetical protein
MNSDAMKWALTDDQEKDQREFESVMMIREDIEKAAGSAGFLSDELRAAHGRACTENPVLAILLLDLIRDAVKIDQRIKEIQSVI